MSRTDMFGAPVSSRNDAAIESLNRAARLMLSYTLDPLAEIDTALAADPDFVMGRCFRAGLFLVSSERAAVPEIAAEWAELRRLESTANARERGHMAAIRKWLAGDFHGAADAYGQVLFAYPRDVIALQFAHQCDFLLGQEKTLRDRVIGVLPAFEPGEPVRGYVLGMLAFGLEECGHYARAEETGREAVAVNADDAWAYHAVAHVMEMQGRTEDGIAWLGGTSVNWAPENMFSYHNWWHLGLYHLERGETQRVLELYDTAIRPESTDVLMEMVDGAAMLWRLHLRGIDTGTRWTELADIYERHVGDAYYPFNDMHAMMAFTATGRDRAAAQLVEALTDKARDDDSSGRMIAEVGLPVVRGIAAFGQGDYRTAADTLIAARKVAQRFGGSHAQRDVLNLTALEAAIRAGDTGAARALLAERAFEKHESPFRTTVQRRIEALRGTARAA